MLDRLRLSYGTPILPNGWIKGLRDGTFEFGWDSLVNQKQASWRKGRQDILWAAIVQNKKCYALRGEGEFWQSDDFEVPLFTSGGFLISRRVEKKLTISDNYLLKDTYNGLNFQFCEELNEDNEAWCVTEFTQEDVGKWLVLEIDVIIEQSRWYLSQEKI